MNKKISLFLVALMVLTLAVIPKMPVYAAGITIGLSSSSVNVGDTVTATISIPNGGSAIVTVTYNANVLSYKDCSVTSNGGDGAKILSIYNASGSNGTTSASITLKAVGAGSTSISVEANDATDVEGNDTSLESAGVSVTVANASSRGSSSGNSSGNGDSSSNNTDPNNGDNSLSALTISAGSLSPAFSYNTTNYTATVDYSVTKLAVSATPSSNSATIASVTGNEDLQVGENTVSIVVKAGNGVTATYTIKVTRRAEDDPENQDTPADSENPEQPAAENTGVGDGKFQIEGQTYIPAETIPEEVIPTDFSPSTIAFGEATYSCLNFAKGNLTLLYLVPEGAEDGTGVLYVYDAKSNSIYQFVKLATESHYVIVLLPDVEDIPEGYTESFLAIEGKGQVAVYQPSENAEKLNTDTQQPDSQNSENETDKSLGFVDAIGECVASVFGIEMVQAAEPSTSDFYLMYCMNDEGETGWYQYDSVEGTYQRYSAQNMANQSLTEKYDEAMKNIKKLTQRNWLLILGMIIGTVIFVVIIIVLVVKNKGKRDAFYEDDNEEDDDDDFEKLTDEEDFEEQSTYEDTEDPDDEIEVEFYEMEDSVEEEQPQEAEEPLNEEKDSGDDDEVEVEFYEMDDVDAGKDESTTENAPESTSEAEEEEISDIDDQLETIVIPSRAHDDEQFGDAAEEVQAKYAKENVRVTKRSMMDKFLDKMSLENEENVDDDFDESDDSEADLNGDGEADGEELLAASIAKIKEKQQERHTERMEKLQDELEQATERLKEMQKQEEKTTKKKKPEAKIQDLDEEDDDLEFLDLD